MLHGKFIKDATEKFVKAWDIISFISKQQAAWKEGH